MGLAVMALFLMETKQQIYSIVVLYPPLLEPNSNLMYDKHFHIIIKGEKDKDQADQENIDEAVKREVCCQSSHLAGIAYDRVGNLLFRSLLKIAHIIEQL